MSNIIFTLSEISFSMPKNWIISTFRTLFAFFDFLVYTIIGFLFRAVFNLANFELYGVYEDIMERVYVILGIFMLFKITISLITYLADPDKISDKQEGISKLITRVIVVMVMLIGLPTFFSLMTEAQNKLIPVIPRVIINSPNVLSSDDVTGISNNLAATMLSGFAHVKDGCNNPGISSPHQILFVVNDSCQSSSGDNSNYYAYDYLPIVSTLTGIIMVYVIFSFCISVAIRAFKLIILRSIAPIPVLSYIDPKSSKDGAFSTWRKTFFSTWLELFINLAIIYFIIYIIDMLLSGDMYKGFFDGVNFIDGIFLFAFLIIGLLMFAKEAPKFVMDALGIKSKGNFTRMLGMGATAFGGIGAARSALKSRKEYNDKHPYESTGNRFKDGLNRALRSGAGMAASSAFAGLASVSSGGHALLSTDKPNLTTGYDAQVKSNAARLARLSTGASLAGGVGSLFDNMFSGQTEIDRMELEWKEAEEQLKYDKQKNAERKTIIDRASTKGLESLATSTDIVNFTGASGEVYNLSGVNAARFNSVVESALSGNGVMRDKVYQKSDGSVISASNYQSMTANRDQIGATVASYKKQTRGVYRDASGAEITDQNVIDQYNNNPNYGYMNGISYSEDVQYTNASGNIISESDYNNMVDSYNDAVQECDGVTETAGKEYFTFNGEKIYVEDAKLLQHDINDGNIADYAEKVLNKTTDSNGNIIIEDEAITTADARYAAVNNGHGVERKFAGNGGLKYQYAAENNRISEKELEVASKKNSDVTKKKQEENKMFNNSSKQ